MPWSCNGARAASMHLLKVWCDKARLKGRTQYWYALPSKTNQRNYFLFKIMIWKYASFRSIMTSQFWDWIWDTISFSISILNLYVCRVRFKQCRITLQRCWEWERTQFFGTTLSLPRGAHLLKPIMPWHQDFYFFATREAMTDLRSAFTPDS